MIVTLNNKEFAVKQFTFAQSKEILKLVRPLIPSGEMDAQDSMALLEKFNDSIQPFLVIALKCSNEDVEGSTMEEVETAFKEVTKVNPVGELIKNSSSLLGNMFSQETVKEASSTNSHQEEQPEILPALDSEAK